MRAQTNETCRALGRDKNLTAALEAHSESTRLWLLLGGGGNAPKHGGHVCVDCQFPNATVACRTHFLVVGRLLTRLRLQREREARARPEHELRRRRALEAHVRTKLGESCCARVGGKEECGPRFCEIHARRMARRRAAAVARRLHESGHPEAERMGGAGLQVGVDVLNPALHPDPACRDPAQRHPRNLSGPTDAECLGRSALHHVAEAHGVSSEAIRTRVESMGVELGETLTGVARATGILKERRHQGGPRARSGYAKQRAQDQHAAAELMRASERRRRTSSSGGGDGRRLSDRHREGRDAGAHAAQAGAAHRHLHRSSRIMHSALKKLDLQATRANNRHLREARSNGMPQPGAPHPDDAQSFAALRDGFVGPMTATLALQAEEGSLMSRFGGAVSSLGALRERVDRAMEALRERTLAQERRERERKQANERRRERSRRLAEAGEPDPDPHPDVVFDRLERTLAERARRRLQEGGAAAQPPPWRSNVLELPEEHALSWVHEVVGDWPAVFDETKRLHEVFTRRLEARRAGASAQAAVRAHQTGWAWFDSERLNRPSAVGEALRRLGHRAQHDGADPPWHAPSVGERVDARLNDREHGRVRRLAEAFLDGTIAAPFSFFDQVVPSGTIMPQSTKSLWEAIVRYILGSVVGCYLLTPEPTLSNTQGTADGTGDDGDKIKVYKPGADKLCFPAVPFLLPQLGSFRVITGTQGVDLCAPRLEHARQSLGQLRSRSQVLADLRALV